LFGVLRRTNTKYIAISLSRTNSYNSIFHEGELTQTFMNENREYRCNKFIMLVKWK